jgi:hypothetical protein
MRPSAAAISAANPIMMRSVLIDNEFDWAWPAKKSVRSRFAQYLRYRFE